MAGSDHLNIVFAGTPPLAATVLRALITAGYPIKGVLTQPDKPAGRGRKLTMSAVKEVALEHDLPVMQPQSLRDGAIQQRLATLQPDIMIVVAYGMILPAAVLRIPQRGCVNIHLSLLPRWRGAACIQRAILAGDSETGVTIMQMDEGLDTGPVYRQAPYPIPATITSGELHDQLAILAAETMVDCLPELLAGQLVPQPQDDTQACYAHKVTKQEAALDWTATADVLDRTVRAYLPWPIAYTHLAQQTLRIWQATVLDSTTKKAPPGTLLAISAAGIDVQTGAGVLRLQRVQLAGGKPLPISEIIKAPRPWLAVGKCFQQGDEAQ